MKNLFVVGSVVLVQLASFNGSAHAVPNSDCGNPEFTSLIRQIDSQKLGLDFQAETLGEFKGLEPDYKIDPQKLSKQKAELDAMTETLIWNSGLKSGETEAKNELPAACAQKVDSTARLRDCSASLIRQRILRQNAHLVAAQKTNLSSFFTSAETPQSNLQFQTALTLSVIADEKSQWDHIKGFVNAECMKLQKKLP
jgi:hypothetical protein